MTNRLLLAMSALTKGQLEEKNQSFEVDFIDKNIEKIDDCIGQLEPSVKYILKKCPEDELEIDVLCTKKTWEEINTIRNREYTAVTYFVYRISGYLGIEFTDLGIKPEDFRNKDIIETYIESEKENKVHFVFIKIDEKEPEIGLNKTVNYIRNNNKTAGRFWVDTHGGFRDISLICSAIVSLLKEDNIIPNETVEVRYSDSDTINRIESSEAVKMFDFVAAMNEFIQFGSADSLAEIYVNSENDSIRDVIDAMKIISDGTRLCDPNTYLEGLEKLTESLDKVDDEDDYFNIFIDYVKRDYGDLLVPNSRTPLKIIERCYKKKLYQQALTFIESLMPEEYVKRRILYYDSQNVNEVGRIQDGQISAKKEFESVEHFFFDQVTGGMYYYDSNYANSVWNSFVDSTGKSKKEVEFEIIRRTDYLALDCIRNSNNRGHLQRYMMPLHKGIVEAPMEKNGNQWTNYVSVYTTVSDNRIKEKAAHLFRIHNAIKRCRNMVNHSSQKMRPSMAELDEAIKVYIGLAKDVLSE